MFNNNLKVISFVLTLAFISFAFYANSYSQKSGDDQTVIKLPSMQCGTCRAKITKALKKVDGVKSVNVDLDQKQATVSFDNSVTDISKLENAITAAGYDANDKKADPDAYNNLDECCKVPKTK